MRCRSLTRCSGCAPAALGAANLLPPAPKRGSSRVLQTQPVCQGQCIHISERSRAWRRRLSCLNVGAVQEAGGQPQWPRPTRPPPQRPLPPPPPPLAGPPPQIGSQAVAPRPVGSGAAAAQPAAAAGDGAASNGGGGDDGVSDAVVIATAVGGAAAVALLAALVMWWLLRSRHERGKAAVGGKAVKGGGSGTHGPESAALSHHQSQVRTVLRAACCM